MYKYVLLSLLLVLTFGCVQNQYSYSPPTQTTGGCTPGSVYTASCATSEASGQTHVGSAADTGLLVPYNGACINGNQCASQSCVNGLCSQCSTNLQCGAGYVCGNHRCVAFS